MIRFPRGFLWGAATAAYQVEGNNRRSDWWRWEKLAGKERSGSACRHYQLYRKDFDLAEKLSHNCHRLSIEWSRIEPKEGKFSRKELKHYQDVILALRKRGIEPVVTLHHFTNPSWLSASGGWENHKSVELFARYCDFVARGLSKHVRYWITVNEPTIYVSHSYIFGAWPPQARSLLKAKIVEDNMAAGHIRVYRLIHSIYRQFGLPAPAVSISQHMSAYVPCNPDLKNRVAAYFRDKLYNQEFLERISKELDFIGLNYYSRQLVDLGKWGVGNIVWDVCKKNHHPVKKNSLGWDIYPQGLYQVLLSLKKYGLPVMITENGICTSDDSLRWEFITGHLKAMRRAMGKGVQVIGYLYWSLMDNFEWDKGFGPRFGLIDIDYKTFKRTVRQSAKKFAKVCKTGVLAALILAVLPAAMSWAATRWEKQGEYYFLAKDGRDNFSAAAAGANKFSSKYLSFDGVDFLVRGPDNWKDYGRLDLEGNNIFVLPIRPGIKVTEVHLLSGGNVGNSYRDDSLLHLYGDNYYYAQLCLTFVYQDGLYRFLSVPVFWDWFHLNMGQWSKDGAKIMSLGINPSRKDCNMYHVSFINPRPDAAVKDILVSDSWLTAHPYSEVFALTIRSKDVIDAAPREDREFPVSVNSASGQPADTRTEWLLDSGLDGWIPGCSANWDGDAGWQAEIFSRRGAAVLPACGVGGDKFSWIEKKVVIPAWDRVNLRFSRHSAMFIPQDKNWTDGLLRVAVKDRSFQKVVYEKVYSGEWVTENADLSAFKGRTVIIRFENHGAGSVRLKPASSPFCDGEDAVLADIRLADPGKN